MGWWALTDVVSWVVDPDILYIYIVTVAAGGGPGLLCHRRWALALLLLLLLCFYVFSVGRWALVIV